MALTRLIQSYRKWKSLYFKFKQLYRTFSLYSEGDSWIVEQDFRHFIDDSNFKIKEILEERELYKEVEATCKMLNIRLSDNQINNIIDIAVEVAKNGGKLDLESSCLACS
jgi:DUF1009 family protein